VIGPEEADEDSRWDTQWRRQLVENLGVLVRQLWQVGVTNVFVDGSFVENKDRPNDIDGYFECDLNRLASGELERDLNLLDPHKVWSMIRNDAEYANSVKQLRAQTQRMRQQKAELSGMGLSQEEVKRAMDPVRSFHQQLKEEVESYERLKRGEFAELRNFGGLGQLLVALRVAQGLSQRGLAERLDVHESQVSRDERNEYHGITVERVERVLEALGAEVRTSVEKVRGDLAKTS